MNLMYMKYAVEVAKVKSINKAAENLYMAQPNLSRAIKELEESLGIIIFDRTPHGMELTPKGEEFLQHAKKILVQVDEIEEMYSSGKKNKQTFSVSVPRASYISYAFAKFAKTLDHDKPAEFFYKETNALSAVNNTLKENCDLGIIRYASGFDKYFKEMLDEKGLCYEMITEFTYVLIMSERSKLAEREVITFDDLSDYVEIAHADPYVPSLPFSVVRKEELPDNVKKRIFVYERGSQFDLLDMIPETFMWVSPIPQDLIKKHHLVQRECISNKRLYKDMLIYKKDYKLTELDERFIAEVCNAKRKYL